jgi:hypothetical protein
MKGSRGRPAFSDSQRDKILELLRAVGSQGVSREELIFRQRWTQCRTRIFELQTMGYVIRSEDRGGRYPTWYVLKSEPLELKPIPDESDWYARAASKPRPPQGTGLPLFDAMVRQ